MICTFFYFNNKRKQYRALLLICKVTVLLLSSVSSEVWTLSAMDKWQRLCLWHTDLCTIRRDDVLGYLTSCCCQKRVPWAAGSQRQSSTLKILPRWPLLDSLRTTTTFSVPVTPSSPYLSVCPSVRLCLMLPRLCYIHFFYTSTWLLLSLLLVDACSRCSWNFISDVVWCRKYRCSVSHEFGLFLVWIFHIIS